MFGLSGIWLYLAIFGGKVIEVTFDTLRIVFVGKGRKVAGAVNGLVSMALWVVLVSSVLDGIEKDPLKAVTYCIAYGVGIYVGTLIEQWIAVGKTSIQIVLGEAEGEAVGLALREHGFGVTILDGHSVDGTKRELVFVQLRRRRIAEATRIVASVNPNALLSVSDVRTLHGGFIK